ncbi:hypothetical protein EKO27_g4873 [Xylaria grammica]|uniref:Uncharacterized protein n=1 Tax=Xylaria grammica TaxID=363999 RepID=A0A439D739_9PEZI|nr:hypothetical protein EKO27_g4873 [Xylaria grammica]
MHVTKDDSLKNVFQFTAGIASAKKPVVKKRGRDGELLMTSIPALKATQSAYTRATVRGTTMSFCSRLEMLPNEIKFLIVYWTQDPQSILRLALTGPVFCEFVSTHEKMLTQSVMNFHIPTGMMHLVLTTRMVSCLRHNVHKDASFTGIPCPLKAPYTNSITAGVAIFRRPQKLTLQSAHPEGLNLSQVLPYLRWHSAVQYYAKLLASRAMKRTPKDLGFGCEASSTVLFRYEKTLYIFGLVTELFSWRGSSRTREMYKAWGNFWFGLYPWEVEQVFCIQKLLEQYIGSVIIAELEEQGLPTTINAIALNKFVLFQGPARLWYYETRGERFSMSKRFQQFQSYDQRGFLLLGHCAPGFGMQIILARVGSKLSSCSYDDADLGPMKVWYHIALHGGLESTAGPCPPSFFSNMRAMVYAGYALWDEIEPKRLPTPDISQMHEEVVRKYGAADPSAPSSILNRTALLVFRGLPFGVRPIPQHNPHMDLTPYLGEYFFYTSPQTLTEDEERRFCDEV